MALSYEPKQSLLYQTCQMLNYTPIVRKSPTPAVSVPQETMANRTEVVNKPVSYVPSSFLPARQPQQTFSTSGSNYSYTPQKVDASGIEGVGQQSVEGGNEKLQTSSLQSGLSLATGIMSELSKVHQASKYKKAVRDTIVQYSNQKKLIDANLDNQEAMMMENLQENMAQLDAYAAAKNVDLSSAGIQGIKDKGLMNMGKDFANMQTQVDLNKKALDLDYAMNVRKAQESYRDQIVSSGFNIASSIFNYSMGG